MSLHTLLSCLSAEKASEERKPRNMSASNHLNPFQMKLFMQAKELMNIPAGDHDDELPMSQAPDLVAYKLHRAKNNQGYEGQSLYENIKEKGVTDPVSLWLDKGNTEWGQVVSNGHHRIAVSNDIDPERWLPVKYW